MKAIPSLLCVGAVYSVVLHLPGPVQVKAHHMEEHISLNSSYTKLISKKTGGNLASEMSSSLF